MKKRKARAAPPPAQKASIAERPSQRAAVIVCLLLALAVIVIYAQTGSQDYVAYDDDQYVYQNPWVKAGLTPANLAWAFTTFFYANWHPLTWISYLFDASVFGLNPGAQHLVNVALHLASAALLFLALLRMTRRTWPCAVVAGIFAVHPLHVESVAWISERKDVLSAFFEIAALLLYVRYAAKPGARNYLPVAGAFLLSLLAKPMAVTFPFLLLLLDYWPLGRLEWPPPPDRLRRLLLEKAPLFAMSAAASVLTFLAQRGYGAVVSLGRLPFSVRLANAAIAYAAYMGKAFWPADLAVLYPARPPSPGAAAASVILLLAISVLAWRGRKRRPYLAVGWLWYLGMLVPVIGLVQVGVQSMADRYTYLPMVGLSIAVVWLIADGAGERPALRVPSAAVAIAVLLAMAGAAYRQTAYWKNSHTLFEHALAVTRDNHIIENNLGVIVAREGNPAEAIRLYRAALSVAPDYADAHANLGHELVKAGQFEDAFANLTKALEVSPDLAPAHADLGVLLAARGQYEESARRLARALALAPNDADNESNLCFALAHLDRLNEAIAHCQAALRINPGLANARFNLDNAIAARDRRTH